MYIMTALYLFTGFNIYILRFGLPAVQHAEFIQIPTKEKSWRRYVFIHISSECFSLSLWMCRTTRTSLGDGSAEHACSMDTWNPVFKQRTEAWSAPLPLLIFSCQCRCSGSLSGVDGHRTQTSVNLPPVPPPSVFLSAPNYKKAIGFNPQPASLLSSVVPLFSVLCGRGHTRLLSNISEAHPSRPDGSVSPGSSHW